MIKTVDLNKIQALLNEPYLTGQGHANKVSEVLSVHSFADLGEDYDTQGIIFTNLDQAMDKCTDLGEEIVKIESWGEAKSLEDIFYILPFK